MTTDLFHWSDEFSVGLQEIDEQHKELVDLLNQLHVAIQEHHGSATSREILDKLVFAEPDNQAARAALASAYDQLGYQAESGAWRNYYLAAAATLRVTLLLHPQSLMPISKALLPR